MDTGFKKTCSVLMEVSLWLSLFSGLAATDVYMHCPADPWVIGQSVTFTCTVLKSAYPTRCTTTTSREAQFRRSANNVGYSERCSLADVTTTCSSSSPECDCGSHNSTHYIFQYTLRLSSDSSGYWDCNVPCLDGTTPQLSYSSNDGCEDRNVTGTDCTTSSCEHGGKCTLSNGNFQCDCSDTFYTGERCEKNACDNHAGDAPCAVVRSTPDDPHFVCNSFYEGESCEDETAATIVIIVVCVVLLVVLLSGGITVIVVKIPIVIVIVVSQQEMEEFKRRWDEIVDFVHKNSKFCCCCVCGLMGAICCCCPLDVTVDYIGENVIKITLTASLIRFFCLRNMTPKVEDYATKKAGNSENQ